jgi:hypothetical protein
MKILSLVLIYILGVLVAIPRFNWGELVPPFSGIVGIKPFDVEQYVTYVEFFRGDETAASLLEGPFSYRPLPPFLASLLPFDAESSLNLINLASLLFSLFLIIRLLALLGFNFGYRMLGGVLFVFSFPYFYYGTSGYVDSVFLLFVLASTFFLIKENWIGFLVSFVMGVLVKETIVLMVPVLMVYLFFTNMKWGKRFLIAGLTLLLFIGTVFLVRNFSPGESGYVWKPMQDVLISNITRVKTYLSFTLSFGIPGLLALLYIIFGKKDFSRISRERYFALVGGVLVAIGLFVYSLFAAYADGRHIWVSYPFSIPLALMFVEWMLRRGKESLITEA